jgi:hypothetical protein
MIETVTGSIASASLMTGAEGRRGEAARTPDEAHRGPSARESGSARGETHGVTVLAVPNDLARDGSIPLARATQLTDDPLLRACVEVDLLAGQRRASAVHAAMAIGLQRSEPAAQQHDLELLDVG